MRKDRLLRTTFVIVLGVLMTFATNAQDNWRLVYENDENGNAVKGSLDELIALIRSGEEVRISWGGQSPDDPIRKVEHFADAKFLTIMSDRTVQAQIDPITGQTPDFDDQSISFKENLEWSMIASSNGKTDRMMRNPITGEIASHQIRKAKVSWFVRR